MGKEIWVWVEHNGNEIHEAALEMLGEARKLGDKMNCQVVAFLIGAEISGNAEQCISYGADAVMLFDDPHFKEFCLELYLSAFINMKEKYPPRLILIAATPNGAGLAPRLAAKLAAGYAANTIATTVQPNGSLRISRSVYLGKANMVVAVTPAQTVVVTMQPGSVGVDNPKRGRKGQVIKTELNGFPEVRTRVEGFKKADPRLVSLDEAERIAAVGCGFRQKQDLELLQNMADSLGAAVGASKPIVDNGWLQRGRLVGQSSGRRLAPQLFVGVGVSGSSHFIEGMKDSKFIVAINKDKSSPLVKMADLTLIGDLYEILPEVTKQIKEQRGEI